MWDKRREAIAWDIVNRVDTVTLCTPDEVREIHAKAQRGEFDDMDGTGQMEYEPADEDVELAPTAAPEEVLVRIWDTFEPNLAAGPLTAAAAVAEALQLAMVEMIRRIPEGPDRTAGLAKVREAWKDCEAALSCSGKRK